jgi:hypothetical protein
MTQTSQAKSQEKSNPREKVFYKHLVLAHWAGQYKPEIRIDSFLSLQWSEEMTEIENVEMMLEGKSERKALSDEEENAINGILLRSKYVDHPIGGGLLIFNSPTELTPEDIEAYLQSLSEEKLEETVEEARAF